MSDLIGNIFVMKNPTVRAIQWTAQTADEAVALCEVAGLPKKFRHYKGGVQLALWLSTGREGLVYRTDWVVFSPEGRVDVVSDEMFREKFSPLRESPRPVSVQSVPVEDRAPIANRILNELYPDTERSTRQALARRILALANQLSDDAQRRVHQARAMSLLNRARARG